MPAPLAVDWNEVKTLALTIGVREAARQMGLPEEAVKRRCSRQDWLGAARNAKARATSAIAIVREGQGLSPHVPNAAEVLANLSNRARAGFAAAAAKVAERAAERDVEDLEDRAEPLSKWAGIAAKAGGWDAQIGNGAAPVVNIAFLMGPGVAE